MEKNIVDYFERILNVKNGRLPMLSLSGHLAELSQKERKHIKKIGGLEKLFVKYPESFLIYEDDVHVLQREDKKEDVASKSAGGSGEAKEGIPNVLQDKKSTVNLESAKDDPCTVCSDPIEIYAIGECRHPICFRCSTKLRVLCEDKNCPVCRQTLDLVVFSKKLLPIDEHEIDKYIRDKKYGIAFENIKICEQKSAVLRHICPKCPNQIFENFTSLEAHARDKHQLYYCNICVRQCKIFTEERKTYTDSELKKHIEYGDDTGSTRGGHPLCEFCAYRYLDNDELLRHLRLHHCSCRICDQVNEEQKNYQFYADKNFLLVHQRLKHFPCEHPDCLELDQIPAFKDEIDLQSHNLQHHSREKSKLEKRAEQRINVPFMYERKVKAKRILKAEKDAVGGINITGMVARHVEKMYSFIERDDASSNFEENVFFDLEACGLQSYDDVREHFESGDRVSAYALPCTNPYAKSKWKAQKVEKIDDFSDDEPEYQPYFEEAESTGIPPLEIHTIEFPSLAANSASTQPVPALAGWSKLAQTRPPAYKPVTKPVFALKPKQKKPSCEIGYIHRNLSEKFGFIQMEKLGYSFEDNVYFNLEAFLAGSQQPTSDLRSVFNPGDKVCYILDDGPPYFNSKTKYRAQLVWKYSHNAESIPSLDPDGFRLVSGKPNTKFKTPALEKKPLVDSDKLVALAEKYKKKLQSEIKNISLSQESNLSGSSLTDSSFVDIEDVLSPPKMEPVKSRTNGKSSLDIVDSKGRPQPSFKGDGETILSLVKQPVSETNSNYSNSINGALQHSQLARVVNAVTVSDDEIKAANSQTTDSDLYSTTDDEDSEDDENDDSDENMINDPHHKLFIDVLAVCINNKAIYKILRQQISVEMEKQGVKDPTQLQFLELKKEDNSAHILFHVPKCDEGGTGYAKLTGFYPLDSSWSSELKTKRMATRITKEYYRINGSSHYIMVTRSKPSRVTLHYRPPCSAGT